MFIEIYKVLMTLSFPILKHTIIKKRQHQNKEHPTRFNERIGQYNFPRPEGKLYWLHGASVGEAVSMLPLIDKLLKEDETLNIMVTTGTLTSAEIMKKRLPQRAFHQFIPFDTPKFAKNLISHFKPNAVLWFESELWPSLLSEIKKSQTPLILVNGRISDSSFKTWKCLKPIAKELLSCFNLCLGQSELDKERLSILGAQKTDCVGNIKFSALTLPVPEHQLQDLKKSVGNRPILFLSSTHHNEEEQFSQYVHKLKKSIPDILIISAPRHPNRGQEIKDTFIAQNLQTSLRSKLEPLTDQTDVYVADTIGEMGLWYNLADISFIGGSLIPHGGQNFTEPSRAQNAVIVGPHMHNFKEMMEKAQKADALYQAKNVEDAIEQIITLFNNQVYLQDCQEKAYNWAMSEAKVLDNIKDALTKELNK
ncbi:MAG: 3-deoxy-D-manno-octulosonic acid transferase [Alphaproteobacteria bacterium]|nr:3-deoxy-D-manno-octulosonic acid transferase [Alphaproteobacteria bacterium]